MKKFVSMVMAAAMIFALAAPAFALKATSSAAVTATMTSPKVAMTAAKVSVTANPYRISIKNPAGTDPATVADQIVNVPQPFINKSDTKLKVYFLVTPGTKNSVAFIEGLTASASEAAAGDDGKVVPSATLAVKFKKVETAYATTDTAPSFDEADQTINLNGNKTCKSDFTIDASGGNDSYGVVADGAITPIALALAPTTTGSNGAVTITGNAIWVQVSGYLNTNVDWTTWTDANGKTAVLDFSIAVYCEPVANDPAT